jgi:hypothetical protein
MRLIVFPDREGAAANLQVDDYAKLILVIQGPDREAKGVSRSMIHCPNCRRSCHDTCAPAVPEANHFSFYTAHLKVTQ